MTDDRHRQNQPPNPPQNLPPQNPNQIGGSSTTTNHFKPSFPNPPEISNPDAATLRDQWKYATRQYGKWYSHAWGTAILAGLSFFALGWVIKGGNPITSFQKNDDGATNSPDVEKSDDKS